VSLADEDTRMMDGLGQAELPDERLQAALEHVLDLQPQDVVQLVLGLVQDADPDEPADERIALEQTPGVFLLEGE
jgi:hypothetical protein